MLRHLLLSASALLALTVASAQPPVAAMKGPQRLEQFLERVQTLSAAFRQVLVTSDEEVLEEARGRLLIKRPGRFRWDYEQPYERVVLANGRELWLYEADLEQATVRPLAAGLGETPAALLTGGPDVLERFEQVSAWDGNGLAWVRLVPRSVESDFESVAIAFAGERLSQLEIVDRLGQTTRVFLEDLKLNPPLDDERFEFEVPDGVDVIREGEL
ncbi:MAG: outer membrane lipoprotein chaperone LolA [Gammaproteobacteria bacterium]|nr:outer membrane lipoprotein chaperone LolA [Gammaproteobacteria bacterium]